MTQAIHKRSFDSNGTGNRQTVKLPPSSKVVGFAFQTHDFGGMEPVIWYRVDGSEVASPIEEWEEWDLQIVGTGNWYDDDLEYLAGPHLQGPYVFHLVGRKL